MACGAPGRPKRDKGVLFARPMPRQPSRAASALSCRAGHAVGLTASAPRLAIDDRAMARYAGDLCEKSEFQSC
jgi:hypothetical protein